LSTHLAPSSARHQVRLLTLIAAIVAALALLPAAAQADTSNTLTVIGTSDVSDSGLVPNLIGPEFEQAFPQFAFKYLGNATLTAINDAKAGTDGPSVLVVHAPSLENQFVAGGYSYQNQYGYAIFRNDFVLAGPAGATDPAGVGANATHNIVQAFIDIATAGINGGGSPLVTLVTRGGGPGTVVAEHQIWQLIYNASEEPTGLILCAVGTNNGGGMAPISAAASVANGAACPGTGAPSPSEANAPGWEAVTGLTQGPNVVFANNCTSALGGGATPVTIPVNSPANTCYVFTDRGTYDYLSSGTDLNAGSSTSNSFFTIPDLSILTAQNSPTAPGGADELINYFHAYIINPTAPCGGCESVNLPAAQDFIKFVTSSTIQSQLVNYLSHNTTDTLGPPFVADASPTITLTPGFPSTDAAGKSVTVTGAVTNAELGFPNPTGETVSVSQVVAGVPTAIPGATDVVSGSNGDFSITFTPPSSGSYEVTTPQISQVELTSLAGETLSPSYGDILSPGASSPTTITVDSSATISSAKASPGGLTVSGAVAPAALDANGKVTLYVRKAGSTSDYSEIGAASVGQGQSAYVISASLKPGKWQVETTYTDPGEVAAGTSSPSNVTVPSSPPPHSVSFTKVSASKGKVTVSGKLTPSPTSSGATVELFAVSTSSLTKTTLQRAFRAKVASVGLKEIAKTSVKSGKTSFTIKTKLKRGLRWVLQLEYVQKGQTSAFSKLSTVAVH
jgi:tungstate transport system substrate-binding protein